MAGSRSERWVLLLEGLLLVVKRKESKYLYKHHINVSVCVSVRACIHVRLCVHVVLKEQYRIAANAERHVSKSVPADGQNDGPGQGHEWRVECYSRVRTAQHERHHSATGELKL